ncbi:MAG: AMP-binding protein [Bacteroidales bacterium]|nr:AMP-binding protein [Bacteroidales bacterium]
MTQDLEQFLSLWRDEHPTLIVHTSGSTGKPKPIEIEKARMRASARMTCSFLGLDSSDTALLCMPLRYIAGMMMVVRAEEVGIRLITAEPSNHPLKDLTEVPTFAAMVPSQVYETLKVERERELFCQIRHVIIGGGALDSTLEAELRTLSNHIWHSYGMTETLSHIALRAIAPCHSSHTFTAKVGLSPWGEAEGGFWFTPLPGITISKDENNCLVIDAPQLNPEILHTHDIVEFREGTNENYENKENFPDFLNFRSNPQFRIIGRSDNVICSGGIKIQIEEVERTLYPTFGDTIQVTSTPHPKFGEIVVYLTTAPIDEHLLRLCVPNLYWLPKRIVQVEALPRTATGKPDRAKAKEMAKSKG